VSLWERRFCFFLGLLFAAVVTGCSGIALIIAIRLQSWTAASYALLWLVIWWLSFYTGGIWASHLGTAGSADALLLLNRSHKLSIRSLAEYVDADTVASVVGNVTLVSATPRSMQSPPMRSLKAYPDPQNRSVIIVSEEPSRVLNPQTFFLYHEIGHLSSTGLTETFISKWSLVAIVFVYGPCILLTDSLWCRMAVGLLCLAELFVLTTSKKAEIAADTFAVARCVSRFGLREVETVLSALLKHFRRMMDDPRDLSYDIVLESKMRERVLSALQTRIRNTVDPASLSDPTALYMLAPLQAIGTILARVGILVIVNISPRSPTIRELLIPGAVCLLFPFVGGYVRMRYDNDKKKLQLALKVLERVL
jgi:hypothetical protein